MNPDGSGVTRLTNSTASDFEPAWSPDRTRIAFISNRRGYYETYVMNADGTGIKRLTTNTTGVLDESPNWSPDSSKLTFTHIIVSGSSATAGIRVINASTGSLLSSGGPGSYSEYSQFSPDGSHLIFDSNYLDPNPSNTVPEYDIVVSDTALGSVVPLTSGGEGVDNGLPDWQPVPAFPLVDARFSAFDLDIQWLYGSGITKGCSVERFCPNDVVTRGQMAAFLDRALSLPSTSTDYFTDDATSIYQIDINRLAAAGITTGCSATTFCPNANVTRGQMAAFLVRALSLPAASTDYFSDDNGTIFEHDINALAAAGITTGCSATSFCPTNPVTRGRWPPSCTARWGRGRAPPAEPAMCCRR